MNIIEISKEEFKILMNKVLSDENLRERFDISLMPSFKDEAKGINLDPGITLESFVEKFVNDDERLNCLQIFKKDRTERGFYRYKILDVSETGILYYAWDIKEVI